MARPGETVRLLCNDYLHAYDISVMATDPLCPICGCRFGRLDTGSYNDQNIDTNAVVVVDVKEPYAHPVGETWVSRLPAKEEEVDGHTK